MGGISKSLALGPSVRSCSNLRILRRPTRSCKTVIAIDISACESMAIEEVWRTSPSFPSRVVAKDLMALDSEWTEIMRQYEYPQRGCGLLE